MSSVEDEHVTIEMHDPSDEFVECWQAAGSHIDRLAKGPLHSWLKADLGPPFLEHLSFRLGNQLFFVRLEDVEGKLDVPGSRKGLKMISGECNGYPCLMPMQCNAGIWTPNVTGWGLIDLRNNKPIEPLALISDVLIEMTDWELQDFAVQVVQDHLKELGKEMMSSHGNPGINPSLWFVGENGPEWVVVRAARYPTMEAPPPENWDHISSGCSGLEKKGHFASVSVASVDDAFDPNVPPTALWRGHAMTVRFKGLSPPPRP